MTIYQFSNVSLSHFSYAILNEENASIILIDPSRNSEIYLHWAASQKAEIKGVIETHPHADFISSHHELYLRANAHIYVSNLFGAKFPHITFNEENPISLGNLEFHCINTPGHSPDSICILLKKDFKNHALFTGDTLFIGDCGRPDLRENTGNLTASPVKLAHELFHSLREKLLVFEDDILIYPAHGAGTLCGKSISDAKSSTLGAERKGNWSLADISEDEFVQTLLKEQPFIPRYFPFDVELNRSGAPVMEAELQSIPRLNENEEDYLMHKDILIIDTRSQIDFRIGHFPNSINLMKGNSFSTWLGSILNPGEEFYLISQTQEELDGLLIQVADIGYEKSIKGVLFLDENPFETPSIKSFEFVEIQNLKDQPEDYTILDIRNPNEIRDRIIFPNSISIPLFELRERAHEIPINKPIVVHCAGGYRSAAGVSILQLILPKSALVFDLGTAILEFI